ncbi:MAG: reverse transcriptase-like protein [Candidatus Eremiobacterota bacterium]
MVNVYVDGSFMPGSKQGAYGIVIKKYGEIVQIGGKLGEIKDNNIAEYGAIIRALEELKRMGLRNEMIKVHTDSQVIARQLLKHIPPPVQKIHCEWYREAARLFKEFSKCAIQFIYSSTNPAHEIAREALD